MSGVHALIIRHRVLTFAATLLMGAATSGVSYAQEPITFASSSIEYQRTDRAMPANLQVMADNETVEVLPSGTIPPVPGEPRPSSEIRTIDGNEVAPLLDDCNDQDPLIGQELGDGYEGGRRGVRPYGGGHPYDWPWGCGG